jgi:DNA-binding MarR family transcriptional regulator
MENTLHHLPRHKTLLDLARQIPEVDNTAIENYLHFLRVATDVLAAQQTFLARFDLSEGKLVLLMLLQQTEQHSLTPSALAEAAGVTRGTITGLLAGLERSGLVKRNDHPEDGRMVTIEITQQALDLLERMVLIRFKSIEEFISNLDEQEQQQLNILLEKMNRGISALNKP